MSRAINRSNLPKLPAKLPRLPKLPDPNEADVFEEMTLLEHMEELRDRVVKISLAIGISFVFGWILSERLLQFMLAQMVGAESLRFQTISPADPLTSSMKVALHIAIAFSLPVIIYQLIAFLAPGLTGREKRLVFLSLPVVCGLFLAGVAFAFYITAPQALGFLSTFRSNIYEYTPTADSTVSFFLALMIGLGITFQLPVVMFLLAKLGVVSAQRLGKFRRHALVVILLAAAIITPGGDPYSMIFVAAPTYALFEVGIVLARLARNPARRAGKEAAAITALLMIGLGAWMRQKRPQPGALGARTVMSR